MQAGASNGPSNDPNQPLGEPRRLQLTSASLAKLHLLYRRLPQGRAAPADEKCDGNFLGLSDGNFLGRVFLMLLRYSAIRGVGLQAAIGAPVHEALRAALDVRFECCASPLNCYHGATRYCSAFEDVDAPFGSLGTFASFRPSSGAYELNPPFAAGVIDAVCVHVLELLNRAQTDGSDLTFVVILPGWLDSEGWQVSYRAHFSHMRRPPSLCVFPHVREWIPCYRRLIGQVICAAAFWSQRGITASSTARRMRGRQLFFARRTHFSHMSHPTFPISHLLFLFFC